MAVKTYTNVPSGAWPLPTLKAHPRLFLTPARITRLQSNWNSPSANFSALVSSWNGNAATGALAQIVRYVATKISNPTQALADLNSAYNTAIAQTYNTFRTQSTLYGDVSALVFDWGYADLTGTQKTNLIAQIESFNAQREALPINGMISGMGQEQGYTQYAMGVLAIQGEAGATDRLATLRNMIQNVSQCVDEGWGDGHWCGYPFEVCYFLCGYLLFHIAGNIENLAASRFNFAANFSTLAAYRFTSPGFSMIGAPSDNKAGAYATQTNIKQDGSQEQARPLAAWQCALYADVMRDGLFQTHALACVNTATVNKWSTGYSNDLADATWLALIHYDPALTPVARSTLPNSAIFPRPGQVAFTSGWSAPSTQVRGWLYSACNGNLMHDSHYAGCLEIWRGDDMLICNEYTYAGQGTGSGPTPWQNGIPNGSSVGDYNMCRSTLLFSPTGSSTPDRSGCQQIANSRPPASAATFPINENIQGSAIWLNGTVGNFVYNGGAPNAKTQATADYGDAYYPTPTVTSVQRIVAYVNGTDQTTGTFFVQDNFSLVPGSVDRIRALWGMRRKPVGMTFETVVTGDTTAGVLTYPNQKVVVQRGTSQATIQMVSPTPTVLRLVGGGNGIAGAPAGPGYESYFDGANLDYYANAQSGKTAVQYLRIQGHWRLECETTSAAANGQMLFAITVGDIGSTAPSYTAAQVLAIMSGSGSPNTMPGLTQFGQKKVLDWATGKNDAGLPTFYLALFTTVGSDDGTGFVEVTGGAYARLTLASSDMASAIGGSPASALSATAANWAQASADWGSIQGWGKFDAPTGGNLWWADYMGNASDSWQPFTCTSASPGVFTVPNHNFSNGDQVAVTSKYDGVLPPTAGSWGGLHTVASATTDTFTCGVNTTGTGNGMVRRCIPQAVLNTQFATIGIGALKHTLA